MSRSKKSSGKEYHRLSQTAESDDEVVLYSLSPSSATPSSFQPYSPAATTEFGSGHYDRSMDLELPSPPPIERRLLVSPARKRRTGKIKTSIWRSSREIRACVCFLLLIAVAMAIILLASSQLTSYNGTQQSPQSPQSSSSSVISLPANTTTQTLKPTPSTNKPEGSSAAITQSSTTKHLPQLQQSLSSPKPSITPIIIIHEATSSEDASIVMSTPSAKLSDETAANSTPPTGTPSQSPLTHSQNTPITPSPNTTITSETEQDGEEDSISWSKTFFPALTETALQLQDMNSDGINDVIVVEGRGSCDSVIHALDGVTGDTVWQAHVAYDAFAVKCDVDLNKDDIIDCIAAGRQSGFRALSGVDGTTIWDRDPKLAYYRYNFYFPLFIPDIDGDGVNDIINTHGGDTTYTEKDTDRSPGFLVVLSGRTGQQLMERVPLPDGHETYMSPVYLTREEGDMILVGTGGETLPGSLWAISYNSLSDRIRRYMSTLTVKEYTPYTDYVNHPCDKKDMTFEQLEKLRPVFDPGYFDFNRDINDDMYLSSCLPWGNHEPIWNEFGLCMYELVSCKGKGVILPPVIVDMTGDLQNDLVVSAFEGRTLVIDGDNGEVVWELNLPGTESYSVPAPLYFNTDDQLDLLVRINYGVWSTYNHSTIAILDGQNGDTLWSLDSMKTGMMSSLSLAADHTGGDAAVFVAVGTMDEVDPVIKKAQLGEVRERRHNGIQHTEGTDKETDEATSTVAIGNTYDYDDIMTGADLNVIWDGAGTEFPDPTTDLSAFLVYCGWSERELTASLYVVTQQQILNANITISPPSLVSHGPYIYLPGTKEKRHNGPTGDHTHDDITTINPRDQRCSHIMVPDLIVSTPAIGDLNNDGRLDIVYTIAWRGSSEQQNLPMKFTVYAMTLEDSVKEVFGIEGREWAKSFLPVEQQPWTRYMGADGDNIYHRNTI